MDMKYFLQNFIEQNLEEKAANISCLKSDEVSNQGVTESVELDENQRSLDAHKFKQAAKVKAGIPLRKPGESLAAYVTRKAKAEAKMKKESEDLDEALPPHLQKHFDKDGSALKGKWVGTGKDKKWIPTGGKKGNSKKAIDVTPKGYGPNESTDLNEDVHNDLNDAIIDFQKKLMRMTRQLDPAIAKEVKAIDKSLDDLRTGPLFKVRPGR
jgi:hypothetical protein